ncbi:MAG: LysM peptidoglycan-binding domain-containing protein [Clostridiales bacterium]|nr:LysM peptidoglycan-binding domain-containing protein [Clostridiales bacterium]
MNTDHTTYHLENFKKPYQVLYITDPTDDSNSFFRKAENSPMLKPVSGYIIYYDKNEPMHEYLLAVKKEASSDEEPKENLTENVDTFINSTLRRHRRKVKRGISLKDLFSAEKNETEEKKSSGLMGSLSFALLFVTLIIGGGLLKSNSRIEYLEKQVNSLGKSYISLRDDVTQSQEVFADSAGESVTEASSAELQTQAPAAVGAEAEKTASYREYTVKPGDTLIYLSRYFYGTEDRVSDIMAANNMSEADMLIEGKTIKIPQ